MRQLMPCLLDTYSRQASKVHACQGRAGDLERIGIDRGVLTLTQFTCGSGARRLAGLQL